MSREEDAVKNDSMIAYETVKYFNAEDYEFGRYRNAVQAYQKAEYRVLLSLNVMNVSQNVVFTLGLLIACFLAAYQVNQGDIKVGQFVAMLTYLAQLQVRKHAYHGCDGSVHGADAGSLDRVHSISSARFTEAFSLP